MVYRIELPLSVLFLSFAAICLAAPPIRFYETLSRTLQDDTQSLQDSPQSVETRDRVTFYSIPSKTRRELQENDKPEGVETQEKATFYSDGDNNLRKRMFRIRNYESVDFDKEHVIEFEPNSKPDNDEEEDYEDEDGMEAYGTTDEVDSIPFDGAYFFPVETVDVPQVEDQEEGSMLRMRQSESKHFGKERVFEIGHEAEPETPPEGWAGWTEEAADNSETEPEEGSEKETAEMTKGEDDEEPDEGSIVEQAIEENEPETEQD